MLHSSSCRSCSSCANDFCSGRSLRGREGWGWVRAEDGVSLNSFAHSLTTTLHSRGKCSVFRVQCSFSVHVNCLCRQLMRLAGVDVRYTPYMWVKGPRFYPPAAPRWLDQGIRGRSGRLRDVIPLLLPATKMLKLKNRGSKSE